MIVIRGNPMMEPITNRVENFETRLRTIQGSLYRFVHHRISNRDDVSEMVQEINLALLQNKNHFDNNRSFLPWALGFATRKIRCFRRKRARERAWLMGNSLHSERVSLKEKYLFDPVEFLDPALKKLTIRQRWLFEQRYYYGKSLPELAILMERSTNCLAACFLRIRNRLYRSIDKGHLNIPRRPMRHPSQAL